MYKTDRTNKYDDINDDYFINPNELPNIIYNKNININSLVYYEPIENKYLDYDNIFPLIKKYFMPSKYINKMINFMSRTYELNCRYICVLFYRGNDKITETTLSAYEDYIKYAEIILNKNPNIKFLIQSDKTEFIKLIKRKFPNNSLHFKDEIRHINKCNNTVDKVLYEKNHVYSKFYLAITIIMSRCKYIVCGSGNCSIWIMFYRGNNRNVYQYLNDTWIEPKLDL